MRFLILLCAVTLLCQACITTESTDFVNYKAIGDVYTTEPQTVDYEEVGNVGQSEGGFFWTSCEKICRDAIKNAKYQGKSAGGDSLIKLRYANADGFPTRQPTCVTTWGWVLWTYGFGAALPIVKQCQVEGIAVSRVKQKELNKQAKEKQAEGNQINININNTQNNGNKPAH